MFEPKDGRTTSGLLNLSRLKKLNGRSWLLGRGCHQ